MAEHQPRWCVLLPCAADQLWALPQACLAEIVAVGGVGREPPASIDWRGRQVPVLDLDPDGAAGWLGPRGETGLVAVILGLQDEGCDYWAVALRGAGPELRDLAAARVEDCPEHRLPGAVTAFRLEDSLYQVPDLLTLQRTVSGRESGARATG